MQNPLQSDRNAPFKGRFAQLSVNGQLVPRRADSLFCAGLEKRERVARVTDSAIRAAGVLSTGTM
jgi:hypothetical protein